MCRNICAFIRILPYRNENIYITDAASDGVRSNEKILQYYIHIGKICLPKQSAPFTFWILSMTHNPDREVDLLRNFTKFIFVSVCADKRIGYVSKPWKCSDWYPHVISTLSGHRTSQIRSQPLHSFILSHWTLSERQEKSKLMYTCCMPNESITHSEWR